MTTFIWPIRSFDPDGDEFSIPPTTDTIIDGVDPLVLKDMIANGTSSAQILTNNPGEPPTEPETPGSAKGSWQASGEASGFATAFRDW